MAKAGCRTKKPRHLYAVDNAFIFRKCLGTPKPANSGRKRNVSNKITHDIREMIRAALDKAGGVKYLVAQAEQNPAAFLTLVGKIIPTQIDATIKRELPEMTRDELLALLCSARERSARDAAEDGREDESPQVH
jgi:hypothetical protein